MLLSLVPVGLAALCMVGVGLAVFAHRAASSLAGVGLAAGTAAALAGFLGADVVAAAVLGTGAALVLALILVPGGPPLALTPRASDWRVVPGVLTGLVFAVLIRAVAVGQWSGSTPPTVPALSALLGVRLLTTHAPLLIATVVIVVASLVGAYWLHRLGAAAPPPPPEGES